MCLTGFAAAIGACQKTIEPHWPWPNGRVSDSTGLCTSDGPGTRPSQATSHASQRAAYGATSRYHPRQTTEHTQLAASDPPVTARIGRSRPTRSGCECRQLRCSIAYCTATRNLVPSAGMGPKLPAAVGDRDARPLARISSRRPPTKSWPGPSKGGKVVEAGYFAVLVGSDLARVLSGVEPSSVSRVRPRGCRARVVRTSHPGHGIHSRIPFRSGGTGPESQMSARPAPDARRSHPQPDTQAARRPRSMSCPKAVASGAISRRGDPDPVPPIWTVAKPPWPHR
jgi:hypothetical protein